MSRVIVAINKLEMHKIDIKTTLLNSDIDEKIYLEQT
jgi:hypothetical protein